jgi:hypothetical protein
VLSSLKGSALAAVSAILLAVIGASTYLASQGTLSGSDWLVIITPILASVGIVTAAHVTGVAVNNANNPPPPPPSGPTI